MVGYASSTFFFAMACKKQFYVYEMNFRLELGMQTKNLSISFLISSYADLVSLPFTIFYMLKTCNSSLFQIMCLIIFLCQ